MSAYEESLGVHASATPGLTELRASERDDTSSQDTVPMGAAQRVEEDLVVGPEGQLVEREMMEAAQALMMLSRGGWERNE